MKKLYLFASSSHRWLTLADDEEQAILKLRAFGIRSEIRSLPISDGMAIVATYIS